MIVRYRLLLAICISILLVGCAQTKIDDSSANVEQEFDLRELVHQYSSGIIADESASITSEQLIITKADGSEIVYDITEEDFFVSIAPYESQTHPCVNHSLTGCQGELTETEFHVFIKDNNGNIIVDDVIATQANGFFDLWLPRNNTYQVKVEHNGKVAESEISTFINDGTCITTMQLL